MAYLGLIRSEDSSGEHRHQGAITKAGNSSARRALVKAAWAHQYGAKVSTLIARRQADVPKAALDIAWKAQMRLCARFADSRLAGSIATRSWWRKHTSSPALCGLSRDRSSRFD